MKVLLTILLLITLSGFCFSQKQETRPLKSFSKVLAANRIIAILQQGTESKVVLNPEEDAWNEEVTTRVNGKELAIRSEGMYRESSIFCYVYYNQSITSLTAQYGGIIRTDSNSVLETKKLEIYATVDGFANLNIAVDELIIEAGSGSDIYLKGKAGKVTVHATNGAKVHLDDLECEDAIVTSIIGAKVWLTAKNNYKATAGSGGKIYYHTEPAGNFERSRITGGNVELISR